MYFGHSDFTSTPWQNEINAVDALGEKIKASFPKFARARVTAERLYDNIIDEDGAPTVYHALRVHIPIRCRFAAIVQDLDYTSPVWLGGFSLAIWLSTLWR